MIRNLLATTALATLVATAVYAQQDPAPAPAQAPAETTQPAAPAAQQPMPKTDAFLATNTIGESVYNGTGDNAQNIGDVNDIVIGEDGMVQSVIVGVGGFLGIGEKGVAIELPKLKWAEANGDRWLVTDTSKEQLEALPTFDRTPYDPVPAPVATTDTGTAPATTAQPAAPAAPVMKKTAAYLATNMIGESVYDGTGGDAQNIGDVNDIVISQDGAVQSAVIGVGGFLGIGEKSVAIETDKLQWAEANGDRWLVTDTSKEQLEALPVFDRAPYDPAPAPVAANDTGTAPAPATTTAQAPTAEPAAPAAEEQKSAENQTTADQPAATDTTTTAAIDKSALTEVPSGELKAEDLVGTTVYGANDENIGEISDIVLTQDGKVDAVIIDVGGFLGVGEKPVAVGFDKLAFMADKDGKKYLYTKFTKEQLDAQIAYDKGSYAEQRDKQRMMVQ
jgi:sporulation protein YlmC with PRC-barrel domain